MNLERLSLTADNPREQIMQIRSYLFQLAEQLEGILGGIDEDNFSKKFIGRMDGIESDIKAVRKEMEYRHITLINRIKSLDGGNVHIVVETDPGEGVATDYGNGTIVMVKKTQGGT